MARRGAGRGCSPFCEKSDYINENISIESRRSESVESAESLKDYSDSVESSEKIDLQVWVSCYRNARHENPYGFSRNDDSPTVFARLCKKPKQSIKTQCCRKYKIHRINANILEKRKIRKEILAILQNLATLIRKIDCHDLTLSSLAKTAKGNSADSSDSAESNNKIDCHSIFSECFAMTR